MNKSKKPAIAAAMLVLALGLSACSSGNGSAPQPDSTQEQTARTPLIRYGMTTEAGGNYDPITNPNAFVAGYVTPVFDTLLVKKDGKLEPMLAESYEADGDTITLKLRDGVTFHDGTPMDAKAVVANLERARDDERSIVRGDLKNATSIEATGPLEVKITVSADAGSVLGGLAGRPGMVGSPAKFNDESYSTTPIGAGPWQVSPESVVGQRMVYTAYDGYWNPEVQGADRIEITLVDVQTAPNALIGNQLDIATVEGRPDQIPNVEAAGFTLQEFPDVAYQQIMYTAKDGPLADARVREAIAVGIDRQTIIRDILKDRCTPQAGLKALPGADKIKVPKQDIEKAKKLVAEAGFPDGVDVNVVVSSAGPGSTILQAMQGQLEPAGIRLHINPLARAQLLSTYVGGDADAYWTVNPGDFDSAGLVTQMMTTMSPGGSDAELEELALAGANATDPAERDKIYAQWNDRFAEINFGIGLCNMTLPYMVRDGIEGLNVKMPLHIDPRGLTLKK